VDRLHARERLLAQTLVGPHRDDPEPLIDGRAAQTVGSQGQHRSFLLAFKAAQLIDLEARLGEPPLLLLDDLAMSLTPTPGELFAFLAPATRAGVDNHDAPRHPGERSVRRRAIFMWQMENP